MKLSIIMPCYNVEDTLERALDSILMQETNFEYEIILVDDCSVDCTYQIMMRYAAEHSCIKVIRNKENSGNAFTFYRGLCASIGEYMCVLDGDDYYTVRDKLKRQVDFLDSDIEDKYVGVATNFIIDLGDGKVSIPAKSNGKEFSLTDFMTQGSGYYHTATYMYRNIFRGNVPLFFSQKLYRGDTPRTYFHLKFSGKKIKVMDFVGSAYCYTYAGIWSKMKQCEQVDHMIDYQSRHMENVTTQFERECISKDIARLNAGRLKATDELRRYAEISIDEALHGIGEYANIYAYHQRDYVFEHLYHSEYLDSLCETLGFMFRVYNPQYIQKTVNDSVAIVIEGLNPKGGGIFAEIKELLSIHRDKQVSIILTKVSSISIETAAILKEYDNVKVYCVPLYSIENFAWLSELYAILSPKRCYYYCSHSNPFGIALLQKGICENIVLFSFDHGFILGLTNSCIDKIVAKRPLDYSLLKKRFPNNVIYIPTWSKEADDIGELSYQPFCKHDALVTASGAARYYKIDGKAPNRYIDFIVDLLKRTNGKHFHYGKLPSELLVEIKSRLGEAGLAFEEHFIYTEWCDNIPQSMLNNKVDIFIEPFPVVSYKLTLLVLSAGIPIIANKGNTRISCTDFIPEDSLYWQNKEDFLEKLGNINAEILKSMSKSALSFFNSTHKESVVIPYLHSATGMECNEHSCCTDNSFLDVQDISVLWGKNGCIDIVSRIDDSKRGVEQADQRLKTLTDSYNDLQKSYNDMQNSVSFRIGRILTWIPRKVRGGIRCVKDHGFKYTVAYGLSKLKRS